MSWCFGISPSVKTPTSRMTWWQSVKNFHWEMIAVQASIQFYWTFHMMSCFLYIDLDCQLLLRSTTDFVLRMDMKEALLHEWMTSLPVIRPYLLFCYDHRADHLHNTALVPCRKTIQVRMRMRLASMANPKSAKNMTQL